MLKTETDNGDNFYMSTIEDTYSRKKQTINTKMHMSAKNIKSEDAI